MSAATQARARPIRVLHVITRMIVGGAQENTMLSCALIDREGFTSELLSGLETGSEGSLHEECRARGVAVHIEPALVREVRPHLDLLALGRLWRFFRRHRPDVVHTHSSKAGLVGFTRVLSAEGAKYNIKANALAPVARTRMTEELLGPMAERLDPALVSPVVAWLAHEDCPVSGHTYSVGGGRVARVFVGHGFGEKLQRVGDLSRPMRQDDHRGGPLMRILVVKLAIEQSRCALVLPTINAAPMATCWWFLWLSQDS